MVHFIKAISLQAKNCGKLRQLDGKFRQDKLTFKVDVFAWNPHIEQPYHYLNVWIFAETESIFVFCMQSHREGNGQMCAETYKHALHG